jgi:hypothetical protein
VFKYLMFVCFIYVKGMLRVFVAGVKYVSRLFAGLFVTASCAGRC